MRIAAFLFILGLANITGAAAAEPPTAGNMTWTAKPDVYLAGLSAVRQQIDAGLLTGPAVPYVTNTLTIMVPGGNPAHVSGLANLARPGLRLVMPNPAFEGIARQIQDSLHKAGGDAPVAAVYRTKIQDGSTVLTHIHHRQSPLFLMQGIADAGVTWQSEPMFQEQAGHPIAHMDIPPGQNTTAILALALNQAYFATPALFVAPCFIRGAIPGDLEADFV